MQLQTENKHIWQTCVVLLNRFIDFFTLSNAHKKVEEINFKISEMHFYITKKSQNHNSNKINHQNLI